MFPDQCHKKFTFGNAIGMSMSNIRFINMPKIEAENQATTTIAINNATAAVVVVASSVGTGSVSVVALLSTDRRSIDIGCLVSLLVVVSLLVG